MCKVAILERFTLFGSGIKSILQEEDRCNVIVQTETTDELFDELGETVPDVIIIDILHGDNSGIKPLKKIRRSYHNVPVLLIVSQDYVDCFEEYISMGVKGFIFNNSSGKELVKAIKKIENGGEYFGKKVWSIFKSSIQSHKYQKKSQHSLTDREVSVLKLFSNGLSYKEIGINLNISPRTVETHKRNILSKLKINSTADMIRYAYRNHILT